MLEKEIRTIDYACPNVMCGAFKKDFEAEIHLHVVTDRPTEVSKAGIIALCKGVIEQNESPCA